MTVGQLIQRLKKFDPDMQVVVRPSGKSLPDDFAELKLSDIVELKTKAVFKMPYWGEQIYDASEEIMERPVKVLSLSGGTYFQRGPYDRK